MNRADSAVFHFWGQFFLALAVDGLWIAWKTRTGFFCGSGLAEAPTASAAVFIREVVNRRPNWRGFGLLFHFSSVSTVTTV